MDEFSKIITLRNQGYSQEDIAKILCVSRRSVIRYLKTGQIPCYKRANKSNRKDPMANFYELAKIKIELSGDLLLEDLYDYLRSKGYQGSLRTVQRKTAKLRKMAITPITYFQREVRPGEVMEGDFTELWLPIAETSRKVYLWVTSLPYSNRFFANGYYSCAFESFADGSMKAFENFNGVAKKYRLDNFSPAVVSILKGKNREVTKKFAEFQEHYGFEQDFCNPASGHEKGNVESNNNHLKKKILSRIGRDKLSFLDLESFNYFLQKLCEELNQSKEEKFKEEVLKPLPRSSFQCFRSEVVSVSKYSTFTLKNMGHYYSVPAYCIGMRIEARVFPEKIEAILEGSVVAQHKRIYGVKGLFSINLEHIIEALVKKPGAMKDWKHREILFERPAWYNFYTRLKAQNRSDREYLSCLKLINTYGRDLVTVAMEMAVESDLEDLSLVSLSKILSSEAENIKFISPIKPNLSQYDEFLTTGDDVHVHSS